MVDLKDIKQAARIATDELGRPVVQIPLDLWEEWVAQQGEAKTQGERILALLDEWEANPDDTPAEWWDEYQAFLKANRLDLS